MEIKIKYFNDKMPKIEKIEKGDWIDLRYCGKEPIFYEKGAFLKIPLGVAMELPKGYEGHIAPRGSTFKNYGLIQTNSVGIVDESYCGDNDQWFLPMLAMNDGVGVIAPYDRICQFRIVEKMPEVTFKVVDTLGNEDRGGHGSTGTS